MQSDERRRHAGRAMAGWLWEIAILAGIVLVVAVAVTARELPAIARHFRLKST